MHYAQCALSNAILYTVSEAKAATQMLMQVITSSSILFPLSQKKAKKGTPVGLTLTHLVLAVAFGDAARVLRVHLVVDLDVEVSSVVLVGLAAESALDGLTGLDGQDVSQVEDGLFPVGVLGVWASAESHGLVAGREFNVEPSDHGVDVVGAAD